MATRIQTREQASAEAQRRFGDRAAIGHGRPASNWSGPDVFYVGWKEVGEWQWIGTGASWDEAFASVKRVKTHILGRLEVFQ
jgi:hypothetical protein